MPWTERERSIMGDVYRIMQKFVDVPTDEAKGEVYWPLLAATLNEFAVKWGINHLTVNAASFITGWLQDVYKEKRDAEWKIEAAVTKYREAADFGALASRINPEIEQHNDDNANLKRQNSRKLLENDTENPPTASKGNKSSCGDVEAEIGMEITTKSRNKTKEAEQDGVNIGNDPRIRDGMLSFL